MGLRSSQNTDEMNYRNLLDRAPQLNRFKVPVEADRLIDNDLVSKQYLPPSSPRLVGFRLDAFNAIKPRITHSPSSDIWDTSITFFEYRRISPVVLYIQVSALQEGVGYNMLTIVEYRLPAAKPGTPMYLDFPRQIQTRRISFKLLGDVAAYSDEPAEQDDSGLELQLLLQACLCHIESSCTMLILTNLGSGLAFLQFDITSTQATMALKAYVKA